MPAESVGIQALTHIRDAIKAGSVAGLKVFGVWLASLFVYGVLLTVGCVIVAGQGSRLGAILAGVIVLLGSVAVGIYVSAQRAIGRGAAAAIEAGGLCSIILNGVAARLPTFGAEERLDDKRGIVVAKLREVATEAASSNDAGRSRWLRKAILTRVVNRLVPKIQALEDVELTPENLGTAVGDRVDRTMGEAVTFAVTRTAIIVLVLWTIVALAAAFLLSLL